MIMKLRSVMNTSIRFLSFSKVCPKLLLSYAPIKSKYCLVFFSDLFPVISELDKAKKLEKAEKLEGIMGPKWFAKFESIVAANDGKYLVGHQITWPDLYFAAIINSGLLHSKVDFLSSYPILKAYLNTVLSIPQIKVYLEKRPETEF